MAIWIDPPGWPAHGRLWSHLISDTSYDELHTFASRAGIPVRGFEGDHFDVPQESYAALVAAGACPTGGRDLARRLRDSGLRFQKRKGERPLAAYRNVLPHLEVGHSLHLVASPLPTPDELTCSRSGFRHGRQRRTVAGAHRDPRCLGRSGGWAGAGRDGAGVCDPGDLGGDRSAHRPGGAEAVRL